MVKSFITFMLSLALVSPVAAQVSGSANVGVSGSADGTTASGQADAQAGVAVPKFISVTAGVKSRTKAACQAACTEKNQGTAIEACVRECVSAAADARVLPTVNKIVSPRDSASGQASGKVVAPRDVATGQSSGKRQHKPMMIIKEWDAATPILMKRTEERKADLQERREEMKAKIDATKAELQTRLDAFKNKTKATIAARIAANLNALNEKLTSHWANQIDKMEALMVRVAAGDVDGDGTADITAANQAIADADAAIAAQAGKSYTVEVTTEAQVKVDVGEARQQLHSDLKAVEEKVKAARAAVRQAASHVDKPAASVNAGASGTVETSTE